MRFGSDPYPAFTSPAAFEAALAQLPVADDSARMAARERQDTLTKPVGSLGRLEDIAVFMAGWQRRDVPVLSKVGGIVFAGNHGVAARGVSAYPASVTAAMVENFRTGGAAINALAQAAGIAMAIVPLELDRPTADFTQGPAMRAAECLDALSQGAAQVDPAFDLLIVGEMGIGNTTAASALCAHSFGGTGADWAGAGTGVEAEALVRKRSVIDAGLIRHASAPMTALETLRRLGGREIAAMAGAILAARHWRIPVLLDGFVCCAGLGAMAKQNPAIVQHCLAGHRSKEAGHGALLARLGLEPLLDLELRLGEGSGAATAVPLIRSALALHARMATFAEAGVATRS